MQYASNRQISLLRKLNRKKYREQEMLFFVEGERAVEQIIGNGVVTVRELFFDDSLELWKRKEWSEAAGEYSSSALASGDLMDVADTENPQGVLALCEIPAQSSVEELAGREGVVIATDALQDPGNLGTIVRSAVWFGAVGLICGKGTVDLFHPKVVRGTAGSTGSLPWMKGGLYGIIGEFEARKWKIWNLAGSERGEPLKGIHPTGRDLLVVGNEAHGISDPLMETADTNIHISRTANKEHAESLNAAIALSIALYQFSKS